MTVKCPACHEPMVERLNRQTMTSFLGCSRYPTCMETMKVPAYVEVKRAGGIELPGFGDADDDAAAPSTEQQEDGQ